MNLKFGTDGIRGPVETKVTPEACLRIGHAAGIVVKELGWDTVLIGKDTRVSGYMLEAAPVSYTHLTLPTIDPV